MAYHPKRGKLRTIHLQPPAEKALKGLQDITGLTISDLCNLGIVALQQGWVKMPDYELRKNKYPIRRKGGQPRRLVEWTF